MSATTPSLTSTPRSYGAVAKAFHWLVALLILTEIPLGLIANDWPYETSAALATKGTLFSLHKTLGITIFLVALLRIVWALGQTKPVPLHPDRRVETWAAETVHWLLYGSLVLMPLSGWIGHAATSGFAPIWWPFGQSLPFVAQNEELSHFFGTLHWIFSKVLIASLLLHVAGALKHHLFDRDATLRRMWFGPTVAGAMAPAPQPRTPFWAASALYLGAIALGLALSFAAPQGGGNTDEAVAAQGTAAPAGWTVDSGALAITVRQLGSDVEGSFENWTAAITFDPEADGAVKGDVTVEIDIASLTLGSVTEDALKPAFFDAEAHPTARFTAEIRADDPAADAYLADGTLTLKGREQPLVLPFTLRIDGATAEMSGQTTLDRTNFGIGTEQYDDEKTVGFDVSVDVTLTATRPD